MKRVFLCIALFLAGCESHAPEPSTNYKQAGTVLASWYGGGERLARHTANGDVFRPSALTAAHRNYPFGTVLRVSHQGRHVDVVVNDRGPNARTGRSLDLSKGAAQQLGIIGSGTAHVQIEVKE